MVSRKRAKPKIKPKLSRAMLVRKLERLKAMEEDINDPERLGREVEELLLDYIGSKRVRELLKSMTRWM